MRECGGVVATAGASVYGAIPREERRVGGRKENTGGGEQGGRGAVKLCKTVQIEKK